MRMIKVNDSERENFTDEYIEKEIRLWMGKMPGCIIIRNNYKTMDELKDDWRRFNEMPYHHKILCNDKSIQLFGYNNQSRYEEQKTKLLKKQIDRADPIKDRYLIVSPVHEDLTPYFKNQFKLNGYLDSIKESESSIESIYYLIRSSDLILEGDNIAKSIYDMEEDIIKSRLNESIEPRMNMGTKSPQLLPEEILDQLGSIQEEKEWFNNFTAKRYGIKPVMENFYSYHHQKVNKLLNELSNDRDNEELKRSLLELGCFPFDFKEKKTNRVDDLINEEVSNFKFINLSHLDSGTLLENSQMVTQGITIYHIDGNIRDEYSTFHDVPNILISFDPMSDNVTPVVCGDLKQAISLNEILEKYEYNSHLDVMFVAVEQELLTRIKQAVYEMQTNVTSPDSNFLRDICSTIQTNVPKIGNFRLYYYYLLNMVLMYSNGMPSNIDPINFKNRSICNYELYNDTLDKFDRKAMYAKLSSLESLATIVGDKITNVNEGFFKYYKLQVLLEYAEIPVEFDKDGNIFIKKKEKIDFAAEYQACHRLLMQYSRVHNYDALKYYTAKLWYMNILIEKKIYSNNKSVEVTNRLPYYYKTRAHILSDFNKYMAEILDHEPEYDFKEYYKTTPFDKSTLKVSKSFLQNMWDYITKLLSLLKP